MLAENLPDAGKAQDFMKKFNQVLGEDEKLRIQLEILISPTCSCKQAEICVVRWYFKVSQTPVLSLKHKDSIVNTLAKCQQTKHV